jgi:hypothetical protein
MSTTEEPGTPETPAGPATRPQRSPKRGMAAAVLSLEAVTLGLTTPVLITIAEVPTGPALAVGLGLALACVLLAGMLRRPWAYGLGWAVQVVAIALGLVIPAMFLLGPVFAALWAGAVLLGDKIERERAEAYDAFDRSRGVGEA